MSVATIFQRLIEPTFNRTHRYEIITVCMLSVMMMSCGIAKFLSANPSPQSLWMGVSDQEIIERLIVKPEGIWAITKGDQVGGQLIFYPADRSSTLQDQTRLPPRARKALWVERISLDQVKCGINH